MHPPGPVRTMSPHQQIEAAARNREIVLAAWTALSEGRWEAIERWFAPGYRRYTARGTYDRDELRAALADSHRAFERQGYALADVVADAERVAFRWELTAVHRGEYLGVPPTHRRVTVSGLTICRVADDLIQSDWASWDRLGALTALGIVPIGT